MNLWELSAAELAAGYARGAFTPRDALDAVLARIEAVNPKVNAIVTRDAPGRLRAAADASGARWKAGAALGAFDGVPLTVKDNITVAGLRAVWGSRIYQDFVPAKDELPVAKLRAQIGYVEQDAPVLSGTLRENLLFGAPDAGEYELRASFSS